MSNMPQKISEGAFDNFTSITLTLNTDEVVKLTAPAGCHFRLVYQPLSYRVEQVDAEGKVEVAAEYKRGTVKYMTIGEWNNG